MVSAIFLNNDLAILDATVSSLLTQIELILFFSLKNLEMGLRKTTVFLQVTGTQATSRTIAEAIFYQIEPEKSRRGCGPLPIHYSIKIKKVLCTTQTHQAERKDKILSS